MRWGVCMKFQTEGNPNGPKILLIHAMFVNPDSFSKLIEYLKQDYFIIMPILDGHDINEDSTFLSIYDEADKIIAYLNENKIEKLDFMLGTSLGAIIALEIYGRNAVQIDKVYLDGGPFFKFGPLIQKFLSGKFWSVCTRIKQSPQKGIEKIDSMFPGFGSLMCDVCCHMTKENTKNLTRACFTYSFPKLCETAQKSVIFLYGTKESAIKCIGRLKKYKYSHIIKKDGYNHCGYLLTHPKEYAEMLKEGSI